MNGPTAGPLAGLKVIELAHIMAGPVCGLMLAEHGYSQWDIDRLIAEGVVVAAEAVSDQGSEASSVRGKASR